MYRRLFPRLTNSGNVASATPTVRETTRSAPCESAESHLDTESGSRVGKSILSFYVALIETGTIFLNANLVRGTPHPGRSTGAKTVTVLCEYRVDRIAPRSGRHQKRFAPKYRYQGSPVGCILASAMDGIEQAVEMAASQVQLLCEGVLPD
jgi:hypothetical protein